MFERDIVITGQGVITANAYAPRGIFNGIGTGGRPARTWTTTLDPVLRDWLEQRAPANNAFVESGFEGSPKVIPIPAPADVKTTSFQN
jgi:hypothetical protein